MSEAFVESFRACTPSGEAVFEVNEAGVAKRFFPHACDPRLANTIHAENQLVWAPIVGLVWTVASDFRWGLLSIGASTMGCMYFPHTLGGFGDVIDALVGRVGVAPKGAPA